MAGLLWVPSALLAQDEEAAEEAEVMAEEEEATPWYDSTVWYGSLRAGIEFSDGDTRLYDGASRWGIRGTAEAGEGLTAVYQFESHISTRNASQPGGRLAFVGLSGGFGSLTMGQIWSASYNHAGVIRDFPSWHTSPDTSARVGNALSYALAAGAMSLQLDAIMDGGRDTGGAVDQLEFGMSVDLGDLGSVAFAHVNSKDTLAPVPLMYLFDLDTTNNTTDDSVEVMQIMVTTNRGNVNSDGEAIDVADTAWVAADGMYTAFPGGGSCNPQADGAADADSDCVTAIAYLQTTVTSTGVDSAPNIVEAVRLASAVTTVPATTAVAVPGYKANHLSAQFGLGALTVALGHSQTKTNGQMGKDRTSFLGVSGSLGDTGVNWGAWSRNNKNAAGMKSNPWTVGVSKSLGGGATTYLEHGNDGNDGTTNVALVVSF